MRLLAFLASLAGWDFEPIEVPDDQPVACVTVAVPHSLVVGGVRYIEYVEVCH